MYIKITADGPEDGMVREREAVHFDNRWDHRIYGAKVAVELPPPWEDEEAKEVLKSLEWDEVHYAFDKRTKRWNFDLEALNDVIRAYIEAGYDMTINIKLAKNFEHEYRRGRYTFLPEYRDLDDDGYELKTEEDTGKRYFLCTECGAESYTEVVRDTGDVVHYEGCSKCDTDPIGRAAEV